MIRRPRIAAAVLAAGLALSAGAAQAQMGPPNPDRNRDGKVTLAEYRQTQVESLLRLDADKNGQVSRAEFKSMEDMARRFRGDAGAKRVAQIWKLSDRDGNGTITRAEVEAGAAQRFARGDADGDGALTKAELAAMRRSAQLAD